MKRSDVKLNLLVLNNASNPESSAPSTPYEPVNFHPKRVDSSVESGASRHKRSGSESIRTPSNYRKGTVPKEYDLRSNQSRNLRKRNLIPSGPSKMTFDPNINMLPSILEVIDIPALVEFNEELLAKF